MKAFGIDGYRQPLRWTNAPEPSVGERDVLVSVEAAGVNQLDEKIRLGQFKQILSYRRPLVLGHDFAGTVTEVGRKVTGFRIGDKVFGRPRDYRIGTFAERIAVDESDLALAPSTISLTEAASLPLVGLTAWQALIERGEVRQGQRVLIHAGAGGVGTIAIQLAKHLGAFVATTTSGANAELVSSLGADQVIDYRTERFEERLSGFDFVLDSLGGYNLERSIGILKPGGRAIGIAGPPTPAFGQELGLNPAVRLAMAGLSRSIRHQAKRRGVEYQFLFMKASGDQLGAIAQLVDAGAIRPIVGATYPFDQTSAAVESVARGGIPGKTVIVRDRSSALVRP